MKKQTQAIHLEYERRDAYDSLSVPVYNTLAYEFDNAAVMAEAFTDKIKAPDYSRVENPTVTNLERRVAALTDAAHATAFNSGMAAISNTFMSLAAQGKNIVTSKHLFGNTYALLVATLRRFGVKVRLRDLTNIEEVREAIDDDTCCVFLEILTNPQLEVADLKAISEVAHEKKVPLVVDSTVIPFTQFSAKNLGVDIEVVSSSKYVSGGATSLGGLVIDYGTPYNGDFAKRLYREMLFNFGAYMTPQVAYMQTIGLETLDARYRVQSGNALELAKKLHTLPQIQYVNYVGLEDNPYHKLAQRQFGKTAGAMICIDLESKEACISFLNNLKLIHRATNLFDNRSLAIHPASTIFGAFSENMRKSMDVKDTTIRLSVGLEDVDDLFEDIKQAAESL